MKKINRNSSTRIKRKNQNLRKRAPKANKQKGQSLLKKQLSGTSRANEAVQPTSKHIHPNQAMPKGLY